MSDYQFTCDAKLNGHRNWVTGLACPQMGDNSVKVVSSSRDKTIVAWKEVARESQEEPNAIPYRRLEGHSDFVENVTLSNNGEFALSCSWDSTMRLWNIKTGECITKFKGHTKDVLSVAFSPDNRQIVSVGRDSKLKMWNVKGDCMYTMSKDCHEGWVNTVKFSPVTATPLVVTGGADAKVKVWSLSEFRCVDTIKGHTGPVNDVAISPDGSLCASAGTDGSVRVNDLSHSELLFTIDCPATINALAFSPIHYWLCAATSEGVRVWDLEDKKIIADLKPDVETKSKPSCTSVAWSADGTRLYSGFTDNSIREWVFRA